MAPVKKPKPGNLVARQEKAKSEMEGEVQTVISGQLEKKIKKQQDRIDKKRGIVFIKHLPHGFFEEQLKKYFEQFGNVTRLRLARSKRTGGSKGFAFVEFEYPEVAQVAADTMHNYMMFKKVVKASYIPPEKQRFNYFKSTVRKVKNKAGKEIYVSSKTSAINRKMKEHNNWTDEVYQKRTERGLKKLKQIEKKYSHLGIDFSNIVVEPKKVDISAKNQLEEDATTAGGSKLKIVGKRKTPTEIVAAAQAKQKNKKETKKELKPEDLLGNTINEDSDDEDFIPMAESDNDSAEDVSNDDNEESSDEETYMHSDEESLEFKKKNKKALATQPKADKLEQLIKRKAFNGGVQKLQKKSNLQKAAIVKSKKAKSSVEIAAVKELAKPLKTIKNKVKSMQKPTTANKKKTRK